MASCESKDETKNETKIESKKFIFATIGIIIIISLLIFTDKDKKNKMLKLFHGKIFIISILIITVICTYILFFMNKDNSIEKKQERRIKEAVKHALIGFLIALMAYLDMVIAPFYLILYVSYFLHMD